MCLFLSGRCIYRRVEHLSWSYRPEILPFPLNLPPEGGVGSPALVETNVLIPWVWGKDPSSLSTSQPKPEQEVGLRDKEAKSRHFTDSHACATRGMPIRTAYLARESRSGEQDENGGSGSQHTNWGSGWHAVTSSSETGQSLRSQFPNDWELWLFYLLDFHQRTK